MKWVSFNNLGFLLNHDFGNKNHDGILRAIIGALIGLVVFIYLYGVTTLNVTYTDWIMITEGDLQQHYLGWEFFRNEPWAFPLGKIQNWGYPFGTTVAFTDSIPLLAIFFKLLNPVLPNQFQYLGPWNLLCFMMQGAAASILIGIYIKDKLLNALSVVFFVVNPVLTCRVFYNSSLVAQWLILFSLYLFLTPDPEHKRHRGFWLSLGILSILIHPYLAFMVLMIFLATLLQQYFRGIPIKPLLLDLGYMTGALFIVGWSIGLFTKMDVLRTNELGYWSANLNTFFSPFGWSRFIKDIPWAFNEQKEGVCYLGLGVMALFLTATGYSLYRLPKNFTWKKIKESSPKIFIILFFILFSLSNKITLNNNVLFEYPLSPSLRDMWSVFRATGRLLWPVYYLIIYYGITGTHKMFSNRLWAALPLVAAVVLQYQDFSHMLELKHFYSYQPVYQYQSPMKSVFWNIVPRSNHHIVRLPSNIDHYADYTYYAASNRMTLNNGYFARGPYHKVNQQSQYITQNLLQGKTNPDTLYIINDESLFLQTSKIVKDSCIPAIVDGYFVIAPRNPALEKYCQKPYPLDNFQAVDDIRSASLSEYLNSLDHYSILIVSVKSDATLNMDGPSLKAIKQQGLSLNTANHYRNSYIAMTQSEKPLYETISIDYLKRVFPKSTNLKGYKIPFDLEVISAGALCGNNSKIMIDSQEYSLNKRGFNLVVYHTRQKRVTEVAWFDTHFSNQGLVLKIPPSEN